MPWNETAGIVIKRGLSQPNVQQMVLIFNTHCKKTLTCGDSPDKYIQISSLKSILPLICEEKLALVFDINIEYLLVGT